MAAYSRALGACRGGAFYGGPIAAEYEGERPPAWLLPLLPRSAAGWQLATPEKLVIEKPEFIGPNFAAFADDLLRVGGFDARLGPGGHMISPGEDTEIQERLLAAGVRGYYVSDAGMRHCVRTGGATVEFAVQRAQRNGIYWGISRARRRGFFPREWLKAYGQWLNDRWRIARWRRTGDEAALARARCLAARWQGRWRGVELGWTWDRQDAASPNGSSGGSNPMTKRAA